MSSLDNSSIETSSLDNFAIILSFVKRILSICAARFTAIPELSFAGRPTGRVRTLRLTSGDVVQDSPELAIFYVDATGDDGGSESAISRPATLILVNLGIVMRKKGVRRWITRPEVRLIFVRVTESGSKFQ